MRLLRPEMATWLLAVPVAITCWALRYRYKWRHRRAWQTGARSRRTSRWRDAAGLVLVSLALTALAGAMMRPQLRTEQVTPTYEERDLVLILDRSVSMRARDVHPSRFLRAVDEIENFLRQKPASLDRVALVGFSGTSVVLSYPTADPGSLKFYLDWVREDPGLLYGTNMSAALESALSIARRETNATRLAPVFVLISDGEDQSGRLETTAAAVTRAGIRVHTIGIGSDANVSIPVPSATGGEESLRDDAGAVIRTRFDEGTLRQLASLTGGRYFRSVTGSELADALQRIATDERRQTGTTSQVVYRDIYLFLLGGAAAALIGLVSLS